MSSAAVRMLRAADYPRMPWRNGAGTTQEVVCNPGGSSAAFDWRLSIADVAADGGFSAFTGYQRIITVLEGRGIVLTVDGREQAPLPPREAYAFSGDAHVQCRLVDGPIRDFNLFYAPSRYHARLQWVRQAGPWTFHSAASSVLVLNAGQALSVTVDGAAHRLTSQYDCLFVDGQQALAQYRLEAASQVSGASQASQAAGESQAARDICDACVIELVPRLVL